MNSARPYPNSRLGFKLSGSDVAREFPNLESLSGQSLTLEHKILLSYLGSVEQILEVLYGQVTLKVLKQRESGDHIFRESEMLKASDGDTLIRASSVISKPAMKISILRKIREKKVGIGSILTEHKVEHLRNITEIGYDFAASCPFRRYTIIHSHMRAIRIMELVLPWTKGKIQKSVDRVGFEPTTSAMPMPYPTGLDDRPK